MKLFSLDFTTLILRFYFLMAIVIGSFFIGQPWLSSLALSVFIAAMMGVRFNVPRMITKSRKVEQEIALHAHQAAHS